MRLALFGLLVALGYSLVCGSFVPRLPPVLITASSTKGSVSTDSARSKWSVALEEIMPAPGLFGRLYLVPPLSMMAGVEGFLQTASIMLPIGMIMNGKVLFKEGLKPWFVKGSKLCLDWGKVSGLFAGGDRLFVALRGKEDEWNTILGSGLASGLLRVNEGPAAMLQGALLGAGFIMAFSLLQKDKKDTPAASTDAYHAQRPARRVNTNYKVKKVTR